MNSSPHKAFYPHNFPSVLFSGKILFYLKTSWKSFVQWTKSFRHYEKYFQPLGHCHYILRDQLEFDEWMWEWLRVDSKNTGENRFSFTSSCVNSALRKPLREFYYCMVQNMNGFGESNIGLYKHRFLYYLKKMLKITIWKYFNL